jgi:hypothetical protein
MTAILVDAGWPPVVINVADKQRYIDCLEASNSNDISPMTLFISELVESALEKISGDPTQEPEPPGVSHLQLVWSWRLCPITKCMSPQVTGLLR